MSLGIIESTAFRKDVKRAVKRGKNMNALANIVEKITEGEPLPAKCRPHKLVGNWSPYWECHIEPDWLLIYETTDDTLYLIRTGTHADLFNK